MRELTDWGGRNLALASHKETEARALRQHLDRLNEVRNLQSRYAYQAQLALRLQESYGAFFTAYTDFIEYELRSNDQGFSYAAQDFRNYYNILQQVESRVASYVGNYQRARIETWGANYR